MVNNLFFVVFSSGTVEFIMDKDQNFYFMEMNTRLQVRKVHLLFEMVIPVFLRLFYFIVNKKIID